MIPGTAPERILSSRAPSEPDEQRHEAEDLHQRPSEPLRQPRADPGAEPPCRSRSRRRPGFVYLGSASSASAPDGTEMVLARRDDEWVVRYDGKVLMSSRQHGSEDALAPLALDRVKQRQSVLVGCLGLGSPCAPR
jgi:hypothetical protein